MASKRMLSYDLAHSFKFMKMSVNAQRLYFYMTLQADDEGFVNNVSGYVLSIKTKMDVVNELVDNGYLIMFETNTAVIVDFMATNKINEKRLKATKHVDEKKLVELVDERYQLNSRYNTDLDCVKIAKELFNK